MKNIQIEFLILKNKMDKTKLHEIDQNEPERIKKVKLEKYRDQPFAESGYRVKLDDTDTKFCWCQICSTFFRLIQIMHLLISEATSTATKSAVNVDHKIQ